MNSWSSQTLATRTISSLLVLAPGRPPNPMLKLMEPGKRSGSCSYRAVSTLYMFDTAMSSQSIIMLFREIRLNQRDCSRLTTNANLALCFCTGSSRMSAPSRNTCPLVGSKNRSIRLIVEDLPAPTMEQGQHFLQGKELMKRTRTADKCYVFSMPNMKRYIVQCRDIWAIVIVQTDATKFKFALDTKGAI